MDFRQSAHTWYMRQPTCQFTFRSHHQQAIQEGGTISLQHNQLFLILFLFWLGERTQNHIFWAGSSMKPEDFRVWCHDEWRFANEGSWGLWWVGRRVFWWEGVLFHLMIFIKLLTNCFQGTKKQGKQFPFCGRLPSILRYFSGSSF